jgi:putative transposase
MPISITHGSHPETAARNAIYRITVRCNNKEAFFRESEQHRKYTSILEAAKQRYGFVLYDHAIMPDRIYLVIGLKDGVRLSEIMHNINRWYARWYNEKHKRTGAIWEDRFYGELITDYTV